MIHHVKLNCVSNVGKLSIMCVLYAEIMKFKKLYIYLIFYIIYRN